MKIYTVERKNSIKIFIIGGAGYIGSHMVKALHQEGYEPITIDNLSTGHKDAVQYGKFEYWRRKLARWRCKFVALNK